MAHGPIFFFAKFPYITCRKIQEICKIPPKIQCGLRNLPVNLPNLDRFSCSKSHLHFKTAFEKIGPYRFHNNRNYGHNFRFTWFTPLVPLIEHNVLFSVKSFHIAILKFWNLKFIYLHELLWYNYSNICYYTLYILILPHIISVPVWHFMTSASIRSAIISSCFILSEPLLHEYCNLNFLLFQSNPWIHSQKCVTLSQRIKWFIIESYQRSAAIALHHGKAVIFIRKEYRATLACLYRTSARFYMLQLISVDSKDVGLLSNTSSYYIKKGSWADVDWKCPTFLYIQSESYIQFVL